MSDWQTLRSVDESEYRIQLPFILYTLLILFNALAFVLRVTLKGNQIKYRENQIYFELHIRLCKNAFYNNDTYETLKV